jgi:hypothetical protein
MKRTLGFTFLTILLLAGGLVVAPQIARNSRPSGVAIAAETGDVPSWVVQLAKQAAVDNGDAHAGRVQVVLTTRRRASQLISGAIGGSDQPTYFVVLKGHFADTHARTPDGRTIYGTVLMLNVDAATQGILDFGLGYKHPPLAELGTARDITNQL